MSNNYPGFARPATGAPEATDAASATAPIPQPDGSGHGTNSSVSYAAEAPAPRRTRRWLWAVPAVALLAVGGGTAFAYTALSGGGAQPDTVLPSNTFGYLRIDMDPSAGQKIAAVRLLNKLPKVGDVTASEDPRQALFESIRSSDDEGDLAGVDYAKDVEPWLGDRAAVGLLPPSGNTNEPTVVLAIQVKDEAAAKASIPKLTGDPKDRPSVTFRDGYALVTERVAATRVIQALDKGTLATNPTYSGDMAALGEQGVLSGWVDIASLAKHANAAQSTPAAVEDAFDAAGRAAFALRFEADYLELAGVSRGTPELTNSTPAGLRDLPASTLGAISIPTTGLVDKVWEQLDELSQGLGGTDLDGEIADIEQSFGLSLPDDLKTLLGDRVVVAMPEQSFGGDSPVLGAKVSTDGPKADAIVSAVDDTLTSMGTDVPVLHKSDKDTLYLATSGSYLDELSAGGGTLGSSDAFRQAVADADQALAAAYLDLDKLEAQYLDEVDPDQREFVKAMRSVGLSVSSDTEGYRFSLRLVGN